ncbi:hypothetical protein EMIHUDRAFT_252761 [Emiliania huxleyi CCMP1516]|uniref:Phosphoribulokinase/uridine kinase domain-containing protein n=2 Tax=Emiliania huxleyi TaxID=2903 RepID=A0A0D3KGB5_EMIH1|nr:hypothetical protein EMIHUDRAFT_252761 [Emiliania huxleyi CCMP1516]EOD34800.1 hypothetical protein EMIHUDRAFT_252761 [Emiliania huxleyi CCMP1516]|eukprot:XP_005787229.1 hypothetical protein EMIHUDRAFT_252761 [Emiliania huxleyi CCMP1516]
MNAHAHSHVAVALAGPSGSGKSTLAVTLAAALRHEGVRVTLLHQDSYFRLPKPASYWSTPPEHDTPAAVDMERLAEDVRAAGRPPPEPDEAARGAEQLQITPFSDFDDDAAALGLVPPVVAVLQPFVREWALLAVRNLTEGCAENQATIAGLKQLSTPTLRVPPGEG